MEEYSNKKFHLALGEILREKNVKLRGLAGRTNLNFTYFSKLKNREKSPPVKTIEIIARGLGIDPEYFLEYRIHKITDFLFENPEHLRQIISYIDRIKDKKTLKVAEDIEPFNDK